MDRRTAFFAIAAIVAGSLVLVAEPDLRWVPTYVAITYAVLSLLAFLDYRGRVAAGRRHLVGRAVVDRDD